MTCSDLDGWYQAITNRPWYQDPQRYYGNYQLSMFHNAHSKNPVSPEIFDIYHCEKPVEEKDWRLMKASMSGMSGVVRKG